MPVVGEAALTINCIPCCPPPLSTHTPQPFPRTPGQCQPLAGWEPLPPPGGPKVLKQKQILPFLKHKWMHPSALSTTSVKATTTPGTCPPPPVHIVHLVSSQMLPDGLQGNSRDPHCPITPLDHRHQCLNHPVILICPGCSPATQSPATAGGPSQHQRGLAIPL